MSKLSITKDRNEHIDTLRGFAMMYVIFIHYLYHAGLFTGHYSSIIKSLFLIEMPLFFFIAGAGNALGRKKTVLAFYTSRLQRILPPYWIYGIVCIVLTIIAQKIIPFDQSKYVSLNIPLVFSPVSNVPYLTWSLWFIPVYLSVMLLFPFLKWYYVRHENNHKKYIPFLFFAVLLSNTGWEVLYEAKMIIFYAFWIYSGLFFNQLDLTGSIKSKKKIIPVILLCMITVLWFLQKDRGYANMQNNKFPPNIVFLVYTVGGLLSFYLFSKYILNSIYFLRKNKIFNLIYKQYIQNCYSIFLYHPCVFLAVYVIRYLTHTHTHTLSLSQEWICFLVYLIITIPASALIGKIFSWGERIKIKKGGIL